MSKDILTLAREAETYATNEYMRLRDEAICEEYIGVNWHELRDERFAELVRADERNSWPAEMEAMERQVNILTDALNDRQRWFDALEAQHKQAILAEREACAKVCDDLHPGLATKRAAEIIRARGENT
jgi:hypothetical protein